MTATTFTALDNIAAFTIAAWMYRGATGSTGMWIISKGISSGRTLLELWSDNVWYCGVNCGNGFGTVSYTGTGLHHVAMTFDGSLTQSQRLKLWIDGSQLAFTGGTNTQGTVSQISGTNLEVGRDTGNVSGKRGSATGISHLLIIPGYALTQSQLADVIHRPGNPPYTPGAFFPMDGPAATTEPDICGNRDGTWVSTAATLDRSPGVSFGKVK